MHLAKAAITILNQLADLVNQISESDFTRPTELLNGSTIGQHVRHTLEFFVCLERGCRSGMVNYDLRDHDRSIERDRSLALSVIRRANDFVSGLEGNKSLMLEAGYHPEDDTFISIETNIQRELMYNIEHAVHHMAIIKIAVREIAPYVSLNSEFGIAASTLRNNLALKAASGS